MQKEEQAKIDEAEALTEEELEEKENLLQQVNAIHLWIICCKSKLNVCGSAHFDQPFISGIYYLEQTRLQPVHQGEREVGQR